MKLHTPILDEHIGHLEGPVKITKISAARRGPCDECIRTMHDRRVQGFWPHRAYMLVACGDLKVRICAEHCVPWRDVAGAQRDMKSREIQGQLRFGGAA